VIVTSLLLAGCGGHGLRKAGDCDGPCPSSKVNHVVVIIQENHTFDAYFGRYCTAATGSQPTCTDGPGCCEAGPATEPGGASPMVLDDAANAAWDPNHTQACELDEMDGGKMDHYVTGASCSSPKNFVYADAATVAPYHALAQAGALADRYFQPLVGQSSSNDMYLFTANFVFKDNTATPDAVAGTCGLSAPTSFEGQTVGDLLDGAGVSWSFYGQGYDVAATAWAQGHSCAGSDPSCPSQLPIYPCIWDGGDFPVEYYKKFADDPKHMRDYTKLAADLKAGTLPQVSYVRSLGFRSEHPGLKTTISDGTGFVQEVLAAVQGSVYGPDTLVLVTWDEGGGFFDHVTPPGNGSDGQPYGTRIPLLVVGPFAKKNTVSHTTLEHSSIVKFIEWNWLKGQTGQLGARDAVVGNLGSLLDPAQTGMAVPE
jgi:phospholipase C